MAKPNQHRDIEGQTKLERIHEIVNDCLVRRTAGESITDDSITAAHPDLMPQLEEWLRGLRMLRAVVEQSDSGGELDGQGHFRCPFCDTEMTIADDIPPVCRSCGTPLSVAGADSSSSEIVSELLDFIPAEFPSHIGRYRIEKLLGKGGFGRVYLAHDEQLGRRVAVKVPHARIVSNLDRAEAYLIEARTIASLEHPHIVPVYDVGSTDEFPCYMVCKYIEGSDLATKLKQSRLNYGEAAELVATVAEALHYAHTQGLVHRDVKPGNILIDTDGIPFVVDFGLALRDGSFGQGARYAGTPAYMSPEQALGEGHRVDGRSDIFSLGVVLYELLVGRRPFRGATQAELFEKITQYEPRPARQHEDRIPKELERICHKAMAKRTRDRYFSAKDFAEDLRHFLSELSTIKGPTASAGACVKLGSTAFTADSNSKGRATAISPATGSGSSWGSQPLKIVPKGLRSFDVHDADFFLELLPGPRDRDGLPDSIRFWKIRIEETDAESTFPVGLIYGPSGCGKSSLVKAGLLPRLSEDVIAVYVEATSRDTETRLLRSLHRLFPALADNLNLQETLSAVRRGAGAPVGKKVLIVLDQFEQWLHSHNVEADAELVQALRQCDGGRLQAVVLVRDDFWLAATRFMDALEVDLLQGHNTALVDLFDRDHARKVLAAFGRAFGKLPEQPKHTSRQQKEFLKQAVAGLIEDDKVVTVRLALFAEMMKGKPWTSNTLNEAGGIEGIGVTFLEETFSGQTAHPNHRRHQRATRAVLKTLLPESGTDIKGQMKSNDELLKASGYADRPEDFDDLIKLLDNELRLITPTDKGVAGDGWRVAGDEWRVERGEEDDLVKSKNPGITSPPPTTPHPPLSTHHPPATRHYQLTHDYLVHSLRDWLARKQRETRRGRAEICLSDREALWSSKPENRLLPSLTEYLRIAWFTNRRNWSNSQRQMMRKAARVHGLHWGIAVLITCAIAGAIFHDISKERHDNLIARTETTVHLLANSRGRAVPLAIAELDELPEEMVLGELNDRWSKGDDGKSLPFAYALADMGKVDVAFLISQIATASPDEVDNLVRACDSNKVLAALESAAEETGIAAAETTTEREVEPHWRRKARLAIVALHLGNADLSTDMCGIEGRPDPSQRTLFISEFAKWHGSLGRLFESISPETISTSSPQSVALRSGLCLAIGSMVPDQIEKNAKDDWTNRCQKWFQEKPDKETHSAAGFVLRKWDKEPKIAGSRELPADRDWYVNTAGMTMLKIPSGKFQRWFPRDKQDRSLYTPRGRQEVELTRPYWLADREVTFGQYRQFTRDEDYDGEKPPAWPGPDAQTEHTDDHPVHNVSWYDAVLFCNWLSDKEELQPCYEPSGTTRFGTDDDAIVLAKQQVQSDNPHTHMGPGIYVIWNDNFKANGYRLPTEAEWEHACRAGTQTIYAFGNDLRMLSDYAYGTEKGGTKLPNGWGMFDMHRSPWEHCFDWRAPYGKDPVTDPVVRTFQGNSRVIRGGGGSPPYFTSHVREEKRKVSERIICQVDALREKWWGFRAARNHVP